MCTATWNDLQRKKPPVFDASTTILYAEDLMIPMFITIKTTRRYGENTETIIESALVNWNVDMQKWQFSPDRPYDDIPVGGADYGRHLHKEVTAWAYALTNPYVTAENENNARIELNRKYKGVCYE